MWELNGWNKQFKTTTKKQKIDHNGSAQRNNRTVMERNQIVAMNFR